MLNVMRRSANTWVIKGLLILVALSFVVWGVGDYVNSQNQLPVAEASGWSISSREFARAYEDEFNGMRQRFGDGLDKKTAELLGLKQRTLNALINRHLILAAGRDMRLTVSPDQLRRNIAANPAFARGGEFDNDRYQQLLRSNRLTPQEFEARLAADIIAGQLQGSVGVAMAVPEILIEDAYALEHEQRVVAVMSLDPEQLTEKIPAADADLKGYLEENQSRYMTPTRVKVRHVVLGPDSVRAAVKVSEEERLAFYEEHAAEFLREERRQARHILVRTNDKTDARTALERIQAAKKRIDGGEAFEAVAKVVSEDVSAQQGGDLGEFTPGMMVKAFDDVAFSLPVGQVSDPVQTDFGYHLIRVDRILPREAKTVEQVAGEIDGRITERKAQELVYERSVILEDQLFASGELKAIAGDLNLHYAETGLIEREKRAGLKGVELEERFLDAAFATGKGDMSALIELDDGRFFALEVTDRQEPAPKTLDDATVRQEVEKAYKRQVAREAAKKEMERVLKALADGEAWEAVLKSHPALRSETLEPFPRTGGQKGASPPVRDAAFRLKLDKPDFPEVIEDISQFKVLRLKEIQPADPKGLEAAAKDLQPKLLDSLGREQLTAYLNGLWKGAGIQVHQEVLDRF